MWSDRQEESGLVLVYAECIEEEVVWAEIQVAERNDMIFMCGTQQSAMMLDLLG